MRFAGNQQVQLQRHGAFVTKLARGQVTDYNRVDPEEPHERRDLGARRSWRVCSARP